MNGMKYLCPSCGALNEEGADYCTGCGIPLKADEARLKEEIERRLRGGEPSAPETAVLRPLPFLAAPDEPGRPAEGAPSAEIVLSKSPLKRKRRWWLLFGGLAAAAVIAAAAALSFFFANTPPRRRGCSRGWRRQSTPRTPTCSGSWWKCRTTQTKRIFTFLG